ncbi:hypothetical protein ACFY8K_37640 [Streptomyces misionensis]|uniref:hypothetical protein n=1 Tax=Streptomyces misionensis TaxID=67331 RepID=UPI00367BF542
MKRVKQVKTAALMFLALAVSACSAEDQPVPEKTVRKLAGSPEAVSARQKSEAGLREVVQAYAEHTPLKLGLVVVSDDCWGGTAKGWLETRDSDLYKISCGLNVTAYFGADPKNIVSVLDGILTAGDQNVPGIEFNHAAYGALIDYYREPYNKRNPEVPSRDAVSQSLKWDPVHDRQWKPNFISEPTGQCENDPPVKRCLREPSSATVAAIRKQYGMVFQLNLGSTYFKVMKNP